MGVRKVKNMKESTHTARRTAPPDETSPVLPDQTANHPPQREAKTPAQIPRPHGTSETCLQLEQSNGSPPPPRSNEISDVPRSPRNTPCSTAKLNELSISIPTKPQISKYNSGGRPSRPGDPPLRRLSRET